jgi:hypothetical protein
MSPVRTDPLGSARATTRASTADPRCATARRMPARRASCSGTSSTMSQVFKNLFVTASCCERPLRHSTRTTVGTTGGQMPWRTKTVMSAAASGLRRRGEIRLRSPVPVGSRRPACVPGSSDFLCDGLGLGYCRVVRCSDLGDELIDVASRLLKQGLTSKLGLHGPTQQVRGRQTSVLDRPIEVVWEVDLHPGHTPTLRLHEEWVEYDLLLRSCESTAAERDQIDGAERHRALRPGQALADIREADLAYARGDVVRGIEAVRQLRG